jgi:hypothetical protein
MGRGRGEKGCFEFLFNVPCGVLMDEIFKYDSIKMVRVENYSVGVFYRSIQVVILGIFITNLSYYHSYMEYGTPSAAVNGWLETPMNWEGSDPTSDYAALPYCATDGSTDYVYASCDASGAPDPGTTWSYAGNSCRAVNTAEIQAEEAMMFFIATYIQDSVAAVGGGSVPAHIASDNGNYFVPNADALLFTFEHAFTYKDIESTRNIKATVMDHNERVFKEFARGESVKMSVAEWLTAAGGISLNDHNPAANLDCDTDPANAIYRLTGVDMAISLDYSNDAPGFGKVGEQHKEEHIVLTIRPRLTKVAWGGSAPVWEWITHPTVGRHRRPYGLRVRFEVIGRIGQLNGQHLLNTLVACFVTMGVASYAANFLCFYLLEDSDLYTGVRYDVMRRRTGRNVTEEERNVITGIFQKVDANGDKQATMEEFGKAIRQMGTHMDDWQVRRLFKKLAGQSFCLVCRRTPKYVREADFIKWWIRTHDTTKEKLGDVLQLLGSVSVTAETVGDDDIDNDPELKGLAQVDTGGGAAANPTLQAPAPAPAPQPDAPPGTVPAPAPTPAPAPAGEQPVKCVVTVPPNVYGGMQMMVNVQTKYGPQQVSCVAPPGVMPGGRFIVSVTPKPPPQQPMFQQPQQPTYQQPQQQPQQQMYHRPQQNNFAWGP